MASFDIQISRPAEKDLVDIKSYISKELSQHETAQKFLAKLSHKINSLEKMAFRNPVVKDERLSRLGIRKLLVDNFLVVLPQVGVEELDKLFPMSYNKVQ